MSRAHQFCSFKALSKVFYFTFLLSVTRLFSVSGCQQVQFNEAWNIKCRFLGPVKSWCRHAALAESSVVQQQELWKRASHPDLYFIKLDFVRLFGHHPYWTQPMLRPVLKEIYLIPGTQYVYSSPLKCSYCSVFSIFVQGFCMMKLQLLPRDYFLCYAPVLSFAIMLKK